MQFLVYLVQQEAITPAEAVAALDRQQRLRTPIGKLALYQKKITVPEVFEVLRRQQASPGTLFGEIAVECGFLSRQEVAELLRLQAAAMPSLEDLLLSVGVIDRDSLAECKRGFAAQRSQEPVRSLPQIA